MVRCRIVATMGAVVPSLTRTAPASGGGEDASGVPPRDACRCRRDAARTHDLRVPTTVERARRTGLDAYVKKRTDWTLYWADRNSRFQRYRVRSQHTRRGSLADIDDDPSWMFWS